ncbi:2-keto-4-pentenoate hydratase [Staphylococcus devriesei]|uniref:2-keto-4-pentenoate hydratase n=1 Tax=Staphylococcus devriesei TaxID=586733 RepID=A0A2K4DTP7_9STAP|nr:2-keto-4-pentenoate hydratase [Staphylococcus devriesei]MCE5090776.1 2-keto-4-pentenoate hydratase [Staphylococcus devriesei]MCE5097789.1 2-keto-4-pentenoate hydratase [Staphylococcus devriesei]PNZ90179.1 2-keto-4-pentenoate hydratase [Staphylococcus devriesei]PTE71047.1 2-keto-4-pentenoate hydratase [Staphylococcus devriesei]PTF03483.1 2-keto-4-pentenoate hydratase [Staphylococcus devriesei]
MTQVNKEVSNALYQAYVSKQHIEFVSKSFNISESEAYKTQDDLINQLNTKNDTTVKGYKVSMTSAATQAIANTDEPAYGTILSNQVVFNDANVSLANLFDPLLEPEIIFELTADLPEDADNQTILESVKIAPGIEIPDARYKDWFPNFTLSDLISDNTATGLIVVGERVTPLEYNQFADINLKLFKDGTQIKTGHSSEVLGNPVEAIKWLNKKLHSHGKQLQKGQFISSGTFISPLHLEQGKYTAEYDKVGSVTVQVVE